MVKVNQQEHFGGFKALKWRQHVAKDDKKHVVMKECVPRAQAKAAINTVGTRQALVRA
jgi:hypothetical protein